MSREQHHLLTNKSFVKQLQITEFDEQLYPVSPKELHSAARRLTVLKATYSSLQSSVRAQNPGKATPQGAAGPRVQSPPLI